METLFFINESIRDYKKVIIYGSGMAGQHMFFKLLQRNIRVECFADADPLRCNVKFLNIPVVHIDTVNNLREEAAIIVSGRYALNVAEELEKRGFTHIFFDYGNDVGVIHIDRDGE